MRALFAALVLLGSQASAAKTHVVVLDSVSFTPRTLTVQAGDTVVWKNADIVEHDVRAGDGSFKSKILAPDQSFRWKAKKKGRHDYRCTLHPPMTGVLIVE